MPPYNNKFELIISYYQKGLKPRQIQRRLEEEGISITISGVSYHIKKYESGPTSEKKSKKCLVGPTEIEMIENTLKENPLQTANNIRQRLKEMGTTTSKSTSHRAMQSIGFTAARPRYCQLIRDCNKEKRVVFCKELIHTNDSLDDVIFTDESSIQLHQNKRWCYRLKNAAPPMCPKPKHPLKVHVWAGISRKGKTPILIFRGIMKAGFYREQILQNTLKPFIDQKFPNGHRFQQDNDPKHKSKLAKQYMEEAGINWWQWPSESCDLNPIEMVWAQLKNHISRTCPKTQEELIQEINYFWYEVMDTELCNSYIDHVYKVAPVCAAMEGRATGDIPNRLFPEKSRNKSFQHFANKLEEPELQAKTQMLLDNK